MRILSHRGYWKSPSEKNLPEAFERSFKLGFGTETDLRDQQGRVVISHDPPTGPALSFEEFLELHRMHPLRLPLALNIKSDGLAPMLSKTITKWPVQEYFFFDMAVPDMTNYLDFGLNVFTRQSDIERDPALYRECAGVWVDTMRTDWLGSEIFDRILDDGKQACIVSPELHGRAHLAFWSQLRSWLVDSAELMLCTDMPEDAASFFARGSTSG